MTLFVHLNFWGNQWLTDAGKAGEREERGENGTLLHRLTLIAPLHYSTLSSSDE